MTCVRRLLPLLCLALLLAACRSDPVATQAPSAPIDLQRFMGTWYVVARVPNVIERGHMASRDEYTLRDDGKVDIHYVYRTGPYQPYKALDAVATVRDGTGNRDWRLRFFHLVPTTQRILEVAPDYSWALIAVPERDLAWIFMRRPQIDERQYLELRKRLRAHGVNIDKVWLVPQTADQVGKRGYDQPKSTQPDDDD